MCVCACVQKKLCIHFSPIFCNDSFILINVVEIYIYVIPKV